MNSYPAAAAAAQKFHQKHIVSGIKGEPYVTNLHLFFIHPNSTMPVDPMDDIELRSVQLQFPNARGSILEACEQRRVPTDKGDVHVAIQGDTAKPAIITYHDLGLNCKWPNTCSNRIVLIGIVLPL